MATTTEVRLTHRRPAAPARELRRNTRARALRGDRQPLPWEVRWLSPIALVALWQLASAVGWLPSNILAAPSAIFTRLGSLVADGTLPNAIGASLQRAALGFLLGAAIAVVAGVIVGLSRIGDAVLDPPMQMVRTVPLLGLVPLFIIWFGIGEWSKMLLVAIGVAIPLYLNLVAALRSIDPELYDVADSLDLTVAQRVRHVLVPGALPGTLVGLRQALGFAWLALIVAEQISATNGLGFMINNARDFLQTDTIVIGLLTYALLGLLTDGAVRVLERRALRWRETGVRA